MADEEYEFGTMDTSAQIETYNTVMNFSTKWGTPFALAIAAFFTSLLVGAGLGSIAVFIVVMIVTRLVGIRFFTH